MFQAKLTLFRGGHVLVVTNLDLARQDFKVIFDFCEIEMNV